MIIDSHCHLDYPNLFNNLDDVIKRAKSNNVNILLTICTNIESFSKIKVITKKYDNVYGTFGIHPHEAKNHTNIDSKFISKSVLDTKKIVGVGETGLDFFYNHSDKKTQIKSFTNHIESASSLNIPIIVHSRNAEADTYEILKSEKKNNNLKVLIHCFTGSKDFAKKLIDIGCYISLSGIITFKNSQKLLDAVSIIPIENLLVETDSPYLSPHPYRGKSNEPSFIVHTVDKLSNIKNISLDSVIKNTTQNFYKLFNI